MEVRFTQTMIVPANLTQLNTTVFAVSIQGSDGQQYDDENEDRLNFTWSISEFT